jgi:hypothetical protein
MSDDAVERKADLAVRQRETAMNIVLSVRIAAVAFVLLVGSAAAANTVPTADKDGVWVDGVVDRLLVTGPATASAATPTPLYVIAPISPAHPLHALADAKTHGFGAHDHVIGLANPNAVFHGVCDLTLVVPGAKGRLAGNVRARATVTPAGIKPLLYAVRLSGRFMRLDRAARIERAVRAGLASPVDTHTLLACAVEPTGR